MSDRTPEYNKKLLIILFVIGAIGIVMVFVWSMTGTLRDLSSIQFQGVPDVEVPQDLESTLQKFQQLEQELQTEDQDTENVSDTESDDQAAETPAEEQTPINLEDILKNPSE